MKMRVLSGLLLTGALVVSHADGLTQPPGGPPRPPEPGSLLPPFIGDQLKLTAEQQKQVDTLEGETKKQLKKVLNDKQMRLFEDTLRQGPPQGGPGGGPGGKMPPGGQPQGKGPPGMGPPGLVVPPFVRDKLQLSMQQQKVIADLERTARMGLNKILTQSQQKQFEELLRKGPGPGGPGGRPPEGKDRPDPNKKDRPDGGAAGPEQNRSGIAWFATLASGLEEASRTGRPILLVSAAPHCSGVSGVW